MNNLGIYFILLLLLSGCTPKVVDKTSSASTDTTDNPTQSIKPLYTIDLTAKYFTIDKLNQLYLVKTNNEVIKFDSKGNEVFRYNNNFLDNLAMVDATDPFNLLLYYPDFLNLITLDRTMNKTGEFDFSDLNLLTVKAVGTSNDNNVWLYDEMVFRLKKINRNAEVLQKSPDMSLMLNPAPKPVFLIERENSVYLSDPEIGILIFDVFGGFQSLVGLKGINRFQVSGNQLIYQKGNELFSYHIWTLNEKPIKLPVLINNGDQVLVQKNRIFIKRIDKIEVYEIKKAED